MPIFMDRHDVSEEVTAEIVADLHQKDLQVQHRFNCKGLTYWFDDKRKTAFCLVEAPDKAAIKEMHDHAHGDVPNSIIEVDREVVESFLGRIEDPEKSQKTELNIINDPAFRTIMAVGFKPLSFERSLDEKINSIIAGKQENLIRGINSCKGILVKHNPNHLLVSFDSVTHAVDCALNLQAEFEPKNSDNVLVHLHIALNAGVPVDEKEGFFEKTLKTVYCFFDLIEATVVLSSEVKELYESEHLNVALTHPSIVALNPSEEKFLQALMDFTEREWSNSLLNADAFCRHLGYSKSRFYRNVVALTGKSPNRFLKEYRLSKALLLLNKKDMNISEVAFETGFNSPAYFSKCFQETFGILPSQYLKSSLI